MTMMQEKPWESTNIMVVLGVRASLAFLTFSLVHDAIDMYNNNINNNESINTNSNNSNGNKYTLVHMYDIIYIYITGMCTTFSDIENE